MALLDLLSNGIQAFAIAFVIALIFIFFIWRYLKKGGRAISGVYNRLRKKFGNSLEVNQNLSKSAKEEAKQEFQSRINSDNILHSTDSARSIISNAKNSNSFPSGDVERAKGIIRGTIQSINDEELREKSLLDQYNKDREQDNAAIEETKKSIKDSNDERNQTIKEAQSLEKFNQKDNNLVRLIEIQTNLSENLKILGQMEERDKNILAQLTEIKKESLKVINLMLKPLNNVLSLLDEEAVFQKLPLIENELNNALNIAKTYSSLKVKVIDLTRERTSVDRPQIEKIFYNSYGLIQEQNSLISIIKADLQILKEEGKIDSETALAA